MRSRDAFLVVVLLVVLVASQVGAQPRANTGEAMSEAAAELYREARKAHGTQDWAQCFAKAKAALAIEKTPAIYALAGDCAVSAGNYKEGAEHLTTYLDGPAGNTSPALRKHSEERRAQARQHLSVVVVTATIPDAICSVDGKILDAVPATIHLPPGEHTFAAKHPGYIDGEQTRTLTAGVEVTIHFALVQNETVTQPDPPSPIPIAVPIVVGALGVAGIAVGIVGEVLRAGSADDQQAARMRLPDGSACVTPSGPFAADCDAASAAASSHDDFRVMEIIGFAIGGAALATAGVLFAVALSGDSSPRSPVTARLVPIISPTAMGITIQADW